MTRHTFLPKVCLLRKILNCVARVFYHTKIAFATGFTKYYFLCTSAQCRVAARISCLDSSSGCWVLEIQSIVCGILFAIAASQACCLSLQQPAGVPDGPFQLLPVCTPVLPYFSSSLQLYRCSEPVCPPVPSTGLVPDIPCFAACCTPTIGHSSMQPVREFVAPCRSTRRWLRTGASLCSFEILI